MCHIVLFEYFHLTKPQGFSKWFSCHLLYKAIIPYLLYDTVLTQWYWVPPICAYIYICVYMCICMYMCIVCIYVYMYICMRVYVYICMHIYVCVCEQGHHPFRKCLAAYATPSHYLNKKWLMGINVSEYGSRLQTFPLQISFECVPRWCDFLCVSASMC